MISVAQKFRKGSVYGSGSESLICSHTVDRLEPWGAGVAGTARHISPNL